MYELEKLIEHSIKMLTFGSMCRLEGVYKKFLTFDREGSLPGWYCVKMLLEAEKRQTNSEFLAIPRANILLMHVIA